MIEKSNLPASWQNCDGYNHFFWNIVPKDYTCFEFTLDRACDQPYSIVKGYTFIWARIDQDILINFPTFGG